MAQGTGIGMTQEIHVRQDLSQPPRGLRMQVVTVFPPLIEIQCFAQLRHETRSLERREVRSGNRENHKGPLTQTNIWPRTYME